MPVKDFKDFWEFSLRNPAFSPKPVLRLRPSSF